MTTYTVEFRDTAGDWHCLGPDCFSRAKAIREAEQVSTKYPYPVRVLAGGKLIWESEGK